MFILHWHGEFLPLSTVGRTHLSVRRFSLFMLIVRKTLLFTPAGFSVLKWLQYSKFNDRLHGTMQQSQEDNMARDQKRIFVDYRLIYAGSVT